MSKVIRTTPWFGGDEKPLSDRPGPYERKYSNNKKRWCWWDGVFFGCPALTPEQSKHQYKWYGCSNYQNLPWRGVLK